MVRMVTTAMADGDRAASVPAWTDRAISSVVGAGRVESSTGHKVASRRLTRRNRLQRLLRQRLQGRAIRSNRVFPEKMRIL